MHEERDDDEDEETGDEEATMTVDDNSQPCGEEDFNEDVKSAIANVRGRGGKNSRNAPC